MAKARTVSVDSLIAELSQLDARRRRVVAAIQSALSQLDASFSGAGRSPDLGKWRPGRRPGFKMSAEAKAKIAAAQRRRWAKAKGKS